MDKKKVVSYEQARKLAQIISEQHHIVTYEDWKSLVGKNVPKKEEPVEIKYASFEEAKREIQRLGIKNVKEWKEYCESGKKPEDIPAFPTDKYKNGWISWPDFLGKKNNNVPSKFLPFREARKIVRKLKLKNCKEWDNYCKSGKKPDVIPHSPQKIYKERGWIGWDCWFGSGLYDLGLTDEEVRFQIKNEADSIGETMELLRADMTDEDILEAYQQDATDVILAVKRYFDEHPREEIE